MEQYSGLAGIYDYLVAGVDFDFWIDYIESLMDKFDLKVHSVADLACGTGNTVLPFARRGYAATGIDIASDMLTLARQKAAAQSLTIDFIRQDMRHFSLHQSVDLITCFHDGLNYLTSIHDIKQTFQSAYHNLNPQGAFIFDLNAVLWTQQADHSGTTVVDEQDMTLIYETNFDELNQIWQINLIGFIKVNGQYQKFTETHQEKAYTPAEIAATLKEAGFNLLGSFDAFTLKPIAASSIRHFYVAQKICNPASFHEN